MIRMLKKDEWNYKAYRTGFAYTYLNEYGMDIFIQYFLKMLLRLGL